MQPTVSRHVHLALATQSPPRTFAVPISVTITDDRDARDRARDARIVAEREAQDNRVLAEAFARPTVAAVAELSDDEADAVVALIRLIDTKPAMFALKILRLEQRVAAMEEKHSGLSARVGA